MSTTLKDRYLRSRYLVQRTIRDYNERPALKAYLEIFLTLTAISLFGLFAIRPTLKTIGTLLKEIEAKEETLGTMNEKVENLKIAKDLYTKEKDKIALIDDAIPVQPKPDTLMLQIEELAKRDSVYISSMAVEDTKILGEALPDPDQALTLTLGIFGDYSSLIKFATDLENLRRPIRYDEVVITPTQTQDSNILFMSFKNLLTPYGKGYEGL